MLSYVNSWFHVVAAELNKEILYRLVKAYPVLIEAISKQRDTKPSKYAEDLTSLDGYRYKQLPNLLAERRGSGNGENDEHGYLELEELKRLLEWKMSRGVYRQSLRGLIASNSFDAVKTVTSEAFAEFTSSNSKELNEGIQRSLKILCKLRGVGPATASLILSVAYPDEVAFFADELFAWISLQDQQMLDTFLQQRYPSGIGKGVEGKRVDKIVGIKYSEAEYKSLCTTILQLRERLRSSEEEISATDIEKAAYVVLQGLEVSWMYPNLLEKDGKDDQQAIDLALDKKRSREELRSRQDQVDQHDTHPSRSRQKPDHKAVSSDNPGMRKSKRLQTQDEGSASKRRKAPSS